MLKRTPFYNIYEQTDAKLTDFGGFEMPVQYDSIRKEHQAVRNSVGLFDVSHMGEIYVNGAQALDLLQYLTVNDVSNINPGGAQYTVMCYEDGGIVDDFLIYMMDKEQYLLVVNASNTQKDFKWITDHNSFDAEVTDRSADICQLAVQGPKAVETLQKLTETDLSEIQFYHFKHGTFADFENVILSATGYTGEDGFELYFDKSKTDPEEIWNSILKAGEEFGIQPCGLGARDTLRLEMGFALYGNDISKDTTPLEARMGWLTKLDKNDFIGREALKRIKEEGISRKLVGFTIEDKRAIPRQGYDIYNKDDHKVGFVTSGTRSITLGDNIGLGYVDIDFADGEQSLMVEIRNKKAEIKLTKPPFVKG